MIKFLDLQAQYQEIKEEIDPIIHEILEKGAFVGGEFVEKFESEFAQAVGSRFAVGVGNGTDAIEIALKAMELPAGSEVILPVNTFFGSLEGISNAGLKPVCVDCGEDYCIDVSLIRKSITPQTSAIMPVHLYGRSCQMEAIMQIAREFDLKVIEDCAQSFGSRIKIGDSMKVTGSIGDIACFSFYPGKNLGAYGDGGAIVTSDRDLCLKVRALANHGIGKDKYDHQCIGRNSRLDAIQAGILSVKLRHIDRWNQKRRDCAKAYGDFLQPLSEFFALPCMDEEKRSVWHLYVVRLKGKLQGKREALIRFLEEHQIGYGIHYPHVLHKDPKLRAMQWSENILSLPIGEHLDRKSIKNVCEILESFVTTHLFC